MNLHEITTTVEASPADLFRLLDDPAFLTVHMPRFAADGDDTSVWLRVDEPETTLSWGSAVHHPGSLDVLPDIDPARSTLVLRLASNDDLSPLLPITAAAVRTVAEGRMAA